MQFQFSSRKKADKKMPESTRWEFLEKISTKAFVLLDAGDDT